MKKIYEGSITGAVFSVNEFTEASITIPVTDDVHISISFDDDCGSGKESEYRTSLKRSYLKVFKKNDEDNWTNITEEVLLWLGDKELTHEILAPTGNDLKRIMSAAENF